MDNNPTNNVVTPSETPLTTSSTASNQETPKPNNDTMMGVLCYIGPLVLVPFLTKKEDPFILFHIKQGLVLVALEITLYLLSTYIYMMTFGLLAPVISLVQLGFLILSVLGIFNVLNKQQKELPLIGKWSSYIKL